MVDCPACGERVKDGVALRRHCSAILDPEKAAKRHGAHGEGNIVMKRSEGLRKLGIAALASIALLASAMGARAQGTRKDDIVFGAQGRPAAGALVVICSQPAIVTTTPCSPAAGVFYDAALTQPLAQPIKTDGLGHFHFYTAPGSYAVQLYGPGLNTSVIHDVILPNDATNPTVSSITSSGGIAVFSLAHGGTLAISSNLAAGGNASVAGTVSASNIPAGSFAGWLDATQFGMRAVSTVPMTTGSCTSGLKSVTLAAASSFQNGDGIVLYGCGASNTLATPGAPTVTPSLLSGPDTNNDQVKAPSSGTAAYSYQIVARDKNGGLTAAGSVGSTSSGWKLGPQQTTVRTLTRSDNKAKVSASSEDGAATGAVAYLTGSTDASFSGFYEVATVPTTSSFTFLQGMDTRGGASGAATGGTVQIFNCNHLSWAAVTGAWEYYIYGRTSGSLALVGVTRPGETTWNDCGATMSAAPSLPEFVPAVPPRSATNDYLTTTIASGAGTTRITLATAAANSASGTTVLFDDGPTLLAAYNAAKSNPTIASLHIPPAGARETYPINSHTILPGQIFVHQQGAITLNETLEIANAGQNWTGMLGGSLNSFPQFAWNIAPLISINTAYPGIYTAAESKWDFLSFGMGTNGLGMVVNGDVGSFNTTVSNSSFSSGSPADYVGLGFVGNGISNTVFSNVLIETNDGPSMGYTLAPYVLFRASTANVEPSSQFACEHCYFVGRGIGLSGTPNWRTSGVFRLVDAYAQALRNPLVEIGANTNGPIISIDRFLNDTSTAAAVGNWGPNAIVTIRNTANNSSEAGGPTGLVTGNVIAGLECLNCGTVVGQNINILRTLPNAAVSIPVYSATSTTNSPALSADILVSAPLHFPAQNTVFMDLPVPTGVSATPASGGSVAVGTHTYSVTAVGVDQGETGPSAAASCTTTTGNQTCDIRWTAVSYARAYNVYRDGMKILNAGQHVTTTRFADNGTLLCCGEQSKMPNATGTGSTTLMGTQLITPRIVLVSSASPVAFIGTITESNTADRVYTMPDATGSIPYFSGSPAPGNCVKWGANGQLQDSRSACGSGGGGGGGGASASANVNYFIAPPGIPGDQNAPSPANAVILVEFIVPYSITFSYLDVDIGTADSNTSDFYDVGIYNTSGTLQCNWGAQNFTSIGVVEKSCAQGRVTLAAGLYVFAFTGNATVAKIFFGPAGMGTLSSATSGTSSSSGALPSSLSVPDIGVSFSSYASAFFVLH